MRLQIFSDLHLEFGERDIPPLAKDSDLVILAGDIAPACTRRIADLAKRWTGARHILYVPGNHEYYGSDIEDARGELAAECERHDVTLLDPGAITIGHVHFIGATLWTDFRLDGAGSEPWAHRDVGENLADFTGAIRDRTAEGGLLTTHDTARRHADDRAFIEAGLSKARDAGRTAVVITHHAPSRRCVRPWFASNPLNAGFASDLEDLISRFQPPLWIHGHMHDPIDERIGETRVIANPRGYPGDWNACDAYPDEEFAMTRFVVAADTKERIRELAARHGVPQYAVLTAALHALRQAVGFVTRTAPGSALARRWPPRRPGARIPDTVWRRPGERLHARDAG